jgi:23S rRNA (uridine2552-2'-O)-methyltransferase
MITTFNLFSLTPKPFMNTFKSRSRAYSITSTKQWIQRQQSDAFVKERIRQGYSSRAALKLDELNDKHKIFKSTDSVLDLGCSPGGWTQVAVKKAANVVGVDLIPMNEIGGTKFVLGDIQTTETRAKLAAVHPGKFNVLISDMAHQFTGMRSVDVPRVEYLCDFALLIAEIHLKEGNLNLIPGGSFVVKFLQGEGDAALVSRLSESFKRSAVDKPNASRKESSEHYFLGFGFRGQT